MNNTIIQLLYFEMLLNLLLQHVILHFIYVYSISNLLLKPKYDCEKKLNTLKYLLDLYISN